MSIKISDFTGIVSLKKTQNSISFPFPLPRIQTLISPSNRLTLIFWKTRSTSLLTFLCFDHFSSTFSRKRHFQEKTLIIGRIQPLPCMDCIHLSQIKFLSAGDLCKSMYVLSSFSSRVYISDLVSYSYHLLALFLQMEFSGDMSRKDPLFSETIHVWNSLIHFLGFQVSLWRKAASIFQTFPNKISL